ncbi:hypothetical protein H9Y05_06800 [Crocinitomicaceae bacterium CZZ-1]|uniref:Uncharacterized protein n=1 Tax=Taishania pollutisoli TaxID=2766479 RepID=A0A8J6PE70_9FLAO|nr:hypothetical protein [Taishania pollutisoli]MBC9812185.1 hypothetical protein [Taishania pollutisoli]
MKQEINNIKTVGFDKTSPLFNTTVSEELVLNGSLLPSPLFNTSESSSSPFKVLLPKKLVDKVTELLGGKRVKKENKQKVLYLAYLILDYQERNGYSPEEFAKPLSVLKYLKVGPPHGSFGERFYKYVFLALASDLPGSKMALKNKGKSKIDFENAIFQSDGKPDKNMGKAMLYRINPTLLKGDYQTVVFESITSIESVNHLFMPQIKHYLMTAKNLWIDQKALKANLDLEMDVFFVNIQDGVFKVYTSFDDVFKAIELKRKNIIFDKVILNGKLIKRAERITLEYALAVLNSARKSNVDLNIILDESTIYIEELEAFKKQKKTRLLADLNRKLNKISNGHFDYNISLTNGRLTTNLTNLNNIAIKYLRYGGAEGLFLGAYDLKSSQPTILANLIANDFFFESLKTSTHPSLHKYLEVFSKIRNDIQLNKKEFLEVVNKKDIYRELASTLSKEEIQNINPSLSEDDLRTAAKTEMMRYLFAGPNFKSEFFSLNKVVAGLEESIKTIKEEFNEMFGTESNHFNLFLQLVESFIFIDNILGRLAINGTPAFTKHDSVLFPRDIEGLNIEGVKKVILESFVEIGFGGELKYTRHFYIDSSDPRFVGFNPFIQCPSLRNESGEKSLYGQFN